MPGTIGILDDNYAFADRAGVVELRLDFERGLGRESDVVFTDPDAKTLGDPGVGRGLDPGQDCRAPDIDAGHPL